MMFKSAMIGILLAVLALVEGKSKADSAISLSKVKTLTLHGDKQTTHRRVSAMPQLTCVGGNGCKHYKVDMMRCQNAGSEYDAEDIQWTCSANLPSDFKLGSTEVVCEGYDNADDPYILKGSCGVEYRLLLTDEGERKYAGPKPTYRPKQENYSKPKGESESTQSSVAKFLFWLVFIGILCLILYRIFNPPNPNGTIRLDGNNRPGWGGGGGGDGDDGFDDPPPPYSPQPPSQPRAKPSSSRASTAGSSRTGATGSGPGFWSGAAAGGAAGGAAGYGAGYYHGSRTAEAERQQRERERERSRERARERERERTVEYQRERDRERERQRERERASAPSWFGSGSGVGSGGSGGFGSPSPSSSRHDSTGFGGTRRR